MATVREIQKNVTRPTSVTLMMLVFQAIKIAYPQKITPEIQDMVYNLITVVGTTGILEKMWDNRKSISDFFKSIFKKDQDGKLKESS